MVGRAEMVALSSIFCLGFCGSAEVVADKNKLVLVLAMMYPFC